MRDPFVPSVLPPDGATHRAKQLLRSQMRALRNALPETVRDSLSRSVAGQLMALDAFRRSSGIALFWPLIQRGEVDLRELDRTARDQQKAIYYPFIMDSTEPRRLGFRRVEHPETLVDRGHRFPEPPDNAPLAVRGDIQLVVVPALAVDPRGHRLGYGMGFYDSVLPTLCPPATTAAVAYDTLLLSGLPIEDHDWACNWVVTDQRVLRCQAGQD